MGKYNPHRTRTRSPRLLRKLRAETARLERAALEASGLGVDVRRHLAAAQKSIECAIAAMDREEMRPLRRVTTSKG